MSIQNDKPTSAEIVQLTITSTPHSTTTVTKESKIAGFSMKGETVKPITVTTAEADMAEASKESAQAGQIYKQVSFLNKRNNIFYLLLWKANLNFK